MGTELAGTTGSNGDPLLSCKHYVTFQWYPEPCLRRAGREQGGEVCVRVSSPQCAYCTESTSGMLQGTTAEANGELLSDILAQGTVSLFTCSGSSVRFMKGTEAPELPQTPWVYLPLPTTMLRSHSCQNSSRYSPCSIFCLEEAYGVLCLWEAMCVRVTRITATSWLARQQVPG